MKSKSFFVETLLFAVALAVFVLPPLLTSASPQFRWTFPWTALCYASAAAAILQYRRGAHKARRIKKMQLVMDSAKMWIAFGALCVTAAAIQLAAYFLKYESPVAPPAFPANAFEFLFCITTFACSAFTEEAIFRVFLPESARCLTLSVYKHFAHSQTAALPRRAAIGIDTAVGLLFALAHRYLGLPAVSNAAAAHIFLSVCYRQTKALWTNTAAHFMFNLLSLFLMR